VVTTKPLEALLLLFRALLSVFNGEERSCVHFPCTSENLEISEYNVH
jgi:hypothetical protein